MKTTIISLCLSSLLFLAACNKENDDNNSGTGQTYTTQGDASGSQQNPPVTTSGSARLVGTYNSATNNWDYSISWSSLTGAASVIEFRGPANAGVNASLLFSLNISAGGSNGAASGTQTLSEQQEAYLLSGQTYFTIITTAHLSGEVRGQILTTIR